MHLVTRGSGQPVLFIHGIPTSNELWTEVVDQLQGRFTCLAVDLPGLGDSPRSPEGLSQLQALAESLERIRIERKIEKWHVVGHDAGSAIAVQYAHQFPERVERLALLSPALFPELQPFHLFRVVRRAVVGELLAPAVNFVFWRVAMRRALRQRRAELAAAVKHFATPFRGLRGAWRFMSVLRWGNPTEVLAATPAMLPQLRMPTLIFHGTHDPALPKTFAQRAGELIPNSKLVMVDAGHFIPLNNPEVVAAELLRFFEGGIDRKKSQTWARRVHRADVLRVGRSARRVAARS
jgi:pimeloyl-ACP methyl ester carboxylesterase